MFLFLLLLILLTLSLLVMLPLLLIFTRPTRKRRRRVLLTQRWLVARQLRQPSEGLEGRRVGPVPPPVLRLAVGPAPVDLLVLVATERPHSPIPDVLA